MTSKAGLLFIADRVTGEPLYDIEERPVPRSDVPGETAAPTQPFPVKPEPLARISIGRDEITTITPELEAFCRKLVDDNDLLLGGPYLPIGFNRLTVGFPGVSGGVSWAGGAFDPAAGLYVVNVNNWASVQMIVRDDSPLGFANRSRFGGRFWNQETRQLCQEGSWGQLVAVDVDTGDIAWRTNLGVTDNLPPGKQATGRPSIGGPITTASGLTFIAAADDGRIRAFETRTGKEVWTAKLPGGGQTNPITFADKTGKQYVAITATGGAGFLGVPTTSDAVVFYALH
jgi:quinoprotein glucose dehydrogenase